MRSGCTYNSVFKFIVLGLLTLTIGSKAEAEVTALSGFPINLYKQMYTPSPALLDISGDGKPEIFGATGNGYAFSLDYQGNVLWETELPSATCKQLANASNRSHSSPAIADLDGDGDFELMVGYGPIGTSQCKGGMAMLDAHTGAIIKLIDSVELKTRLKFWAMFPAIYSTPAISDLDNNGLKEIIWGSFDRHIYQYTTRVDGTIKLKYQYQAADTVWSSAATYDQDGDGEKEIFIGTDISKNTLISPPTPNGGYIYSLAATPRAGTWKQVFRSTTVVNWRRSINQTAFGVPTIADVISSNPGPEMIMGTGYYFQGEVGKFFKVFRLSDGKVLRTFTVGKPSASQPAPADLDGDGDLELVFTIDGGEVRAVDPETGITMWSHFTSRDDVGHTSPAIADLDCNGSLEVIFGSANSLTILSGQDGEVLKTLNTGPGLATPAIGDLNEDGKIDIIATNNKGVYGFTNFNQVGSAPMANQTNCAIPVPMFRFNAARTGVYGE
jgi:hypothetical protein